VRAVTRVLGVQAVVTELDVKLPDLIQVSDEDIARAAIDALSWNSLVPRDRLKIQVSSGWITLEGDVEWHYQKTAAYNALCNLNGVRGVNDKIVVRPTSIRNVVKAHIESALRRTFGRRTNRITVETRRDHVILWGTVNTVAERAEAERAAWTTPGVCNVENHLSIAGSITQTKRRSK
jgi:osmotically-inducible protein OsmY